MSETELLFPLSVTDGDWAIADVSIVVVTDSQSDPWHCWRVTMTSGTSWYSSTNSTSYVGLSFHPKTFDSQRSWEPWVAPMA